MKTLTILQPSTGLILLGEKRVETRGWYTSVRGRVAIHAGLSKAYLKDWPQKGLHWACNTFGCILGTVKIVDCVLLSRIAEHGYILLATEQERRLGDWSHGRYGFILSDPILFPEPVPAKGKQGWWNWEPCEVRDDA